jgi:hypothetical protein
MASYDVAITIHQSILDGEGGGGTGGGGGGGGKKPTASTPGKKARAASPTTARAASPTTRGGSGIGSGGGGSTVIGPETTPRIWSFVHTRRIAHVSPVVSPHMNKQFGRLTMLAASFRSVWSVHQT